jgi:enamine deaminase RidA (YjgF/YER057c/UK114 family)
MQILQPPSWARARGYSNGVAARGTLVFISGQIGWDAQQHFHSDNFVEQAAQALRNIVAVLAESGGKPSDLVRLNWYVVDKHEYIASYKPLGTIYREIIGAHYPAMTAFQVVALIEDRARVEIEATAVIADAS